jgi:catechol 2,3-dioxygenase-like lactoylglutathione lyase family enzyme
MAAVSSMIRTALLVSDLERSTAFYKEMFDLTEVYAEGELTNEVSAKLLGRPASTKTRYRILKADPKLNRGMIGLFELSGPKPPKLEVVRDTGHIGQACLVFYCADLAAVTRKLEAGGYDILCPPLYLQVRDGLGQPEMTFFDPDGIMINLIQRAPDDPN